MLNKYINSSRLAIAGVGLTVIGLFGLIPMLYNNDGVAVAANQANASSAVAAPAEIKQAAPVAPQAVSGHPVRIVAASVGVDMPVVDGFYDSTTGDWTLYSDKAQFAA